MPGGSGRYERAAPGTRVVNVEMGSSACSQLKPQLCMRSPGEKSIQGEEKPKQANMQMTIKKKKKDESASD